MSASAGQREYENSAFVAQTSFEGETSGDSHEMLNFFSVKHLRSVAYSGRLRVNWVQERTERANEDTKE